MTFSSHQVSFRYYSIYIWGKISYIWLMRCSIDCRKCLTGHVAYLSGTPRISEDICSVAIAQDPEVFQIKSFLHTLWNFPNISHSLFVLRSSPERWRRDHHVVDQHGEADSIVERIRCWTRRSAGTIKVESFTPNIESYGMVASHLLGKPAQFFLKGSMPQHWFRRYALNCILASFV